METTRTMDGRKVFLPEGEMFSNLKRNLPLRPSSKKAKRLIERSAFNKNTELNLLMLCFIEHQCATRCALISFKTQKGGWVSVAH